MIIPQKLVAGVSVSTAVASYYVAPTNTKAIIQNMTLTNTSTVAVTTTVYVVATGATESAGNMIINGRVLAVGETYTCPEAIGKVILATGTIRAAAQTVSTISLQVDGVEVT